MISKRFGLLFSLALAGILFLSSSAQAATASPTTEPTSQPSGQVVQLDNQLANCLKDKLGPDAFSSIKEGQRTPTETEAEKVAPCFAQFGSVAKKIKPPVKNDGGKQKPNFSPETAACLRGIFGENYEEILSQVKNADEGNKVRQQAGSCFGGKDKDKHGGDQVKDCVVQTVGEAEAIKMFNGERPSEDSELYKKLTAAGCLKKFERPSGQAGDRPKDANLPDDKKQCIEGIIGKLDAEPTEEQKREVGTKCFGGQTGPGGPGRPTGEDNGAGLANGGQRPALPSAVQACLEQIGDFKKDPNLLSDEQKAKASECFRQNNFTPAGAVGTRPDGQNKPGSQQGPPQLPAETKACIEKLTGQSISDATFTDETKRKIAQECFAGQRPDGAVNDPNAQRPTSPVAPRPNEAPDKQDCANQAIASLQGQQLSDQEVRQAVAAKCYGGKLGAPADGGQPPAGAPKISDEQKNCADGVFGKPASELTGEQKREVAAKCFGGQPSPDGIPSVRPPFKPNGEVNDQGANKPVEPPVSPPPIQ